MAFWPFSVLLWLSIISRDTAEKGCSPVIYQLHEKEHQHLFKFRIGDKVQIIATKAKGEVIGGNCDPASGRQYIYYTIRRGDGRTSIVSEDGIEPVM